MTKIWIFDPFQIRCAGYPNVLKGHEEFEVGHVSPTLDASIIPDGSTVVVCDDFNETPLLQFVKEVAGRTRVMVMVKHFDPQRARALINHGAKGCAEWSVTPEQFITALAKVAAGEICMVSNRPEPAGVATEILGTLTHREWDVCEQIAEGRKNKEIAEALTIKAGTVKVHLMHIFEKTGCKDRFELAIRWPAIKAKLGEKPKAKTART